MYDLGIMNGLVYIDNQFIETNVYIKDSKIAEISSSILKCSEIYDCNKSLVIPGIIDPHTHFELDLGDKTSLDDFYSGTKAAVYGGVTTVVDFLDPVDNAIDLETSFHKRIEQAQISNIDYKFHACLKNPKGNVKELVAKASTLGLTTIKIFTTYSDSQRRTYDNEIKELLLETKQKDMLVTAHIENDDLIDTNNHYTYRDLSKSRPTKSETKEALKLAKLVKETDGKLYMVHLSSGNTLEKLNEKYSDILNKQFFIESCPHYFTFDDSYLNQEEGYLYTLAPPLRTKKEQELLAQLIDNVDTIGTDHCSFNRDLKNKKLLRDTPLGIGGIEFSFPLLYSKFGDKIIDKMTKNVAKIHHLFPRKGIIQVGSDADLFIYQLRDQTIVHSHNLQDHNLYQGLPVNGNVKTTIVNGKFVLKDNVFIEHKGKLLNKVVNT